MAKAVAISDTNAFRERPPAWRTTVLGGCYELVSVAGAICRARSSAR